MVSLDKAQAAAQARSAVPLLPEELRAMARARPQFQSSALSYRTDRAPTPPPLLLLPTQSSTEDVDRDARSSLTALHAPVSELLAPVALQPRTFSRGKAMEALGINTPGLRSPRSFSKHKVPPVGPRTLDYAHYLPGRQTPDSAVSEKSEAQQLSEEYHASLTNQYREENMFGPRKDSFESTSAEMKMIPQPLFFHRKASSISFAGHGRAGSVGPSPTASNKASIASSRDNRRSSLRDRIRLPSMPFKLSLTPSSTGSDRRRSTSGSIPISPPYNLRLAEPFTVLNEAPSTARRPSASRAYARRNSDPNRFSAFYPRTNPKNADGVSKRRLFGKAKAPEPNTPPLPLHIPAILAARANSPAQSKASTKRTSKGSMGSGTGTSSSAGESPTSLYQRITAGAAKWGDSLSKPSLPHHHHDAATDHNRHTHPHPPFPTPSPTPPHAHGATPRRSKPQPHTLPDALHSVLDRARGASRPAGTKTALLTHKLGPARPLNETREALRADGGTEAAAAAKQGLFALAVEARRESRAVRRREELKRLIRVVPEGEGKAGPEVVLLGGEGGGWV
ncbi:hypothetical protein LTR28_008862 [Elasticomyces elasticus]|nr:hypothetical protein LTR28_008862 [Elasticomyces elasticus]